MMRRDRRGEMGAAGWAALPVTRAASFAGSTAVSPSPMGLRETSPTTGVRQKGPFRCLFVPCKTLAIEKDEIFRKLYDLEQVQLDPSRSATEKAAASAEATELLARYNAILEREGGCC